MKSYTVPVIYTMHRCNFFAQRIGIKCYINNNQLKLLNIDQQTWIRTINHLYGNSDTRVLMLSLQIIHDQ